MAANSKDIRETLFKINQLVAEDLLNTAKTDLLNEFANDSTIDQLGLDAKTAYQTAVQKIGRKRLAEARKRMSSIQEDHTYNIDAALARKLLLKLVASNDPLVTLAARKLDSLADAETIALVKELIEVGAIDKDSLS